MASTAYVKGNKVNYIEKRRKAHYLIVVQGYSQKETSQQLKVSEKTVSHWARGGKWKDQKPENKKGAIGYEPVTQNFFIQLMDKEPQLYERVAELWRDYLSDLWAQFQQEC